MGEVLLQPLVMHALELVICVSSPPPLAGKPASVNHSLSKVQTKILDSRQELV